MSETYQSCLAYLYGLQKHGIKLGLDTIRALLSQCHHPEKTFGVLHIGGTNGKGSTAAMTAAILRAAKFRVGLYTSPHLIDFRERIQVQGEQIAESRVVDLVERFRTYRVSTSFPTFFEITTAMAFKHFADEQVDIAVMEVGMGGRFDATNVCEPIGTLVTNVSLDHEAYLGDTLGAIAFEKAGIIKKRVPVVLGPMSEEASTVIRQKAREEQAPVFQYGTDFTFEVQGKGLFGYQGATHKYDGLSCALNGDHQLINAACAIALVENGIGASRKVSKEALVEGLGSVTWAGRLETLTTNPFLVCDGAHNSAGAAVLRQYLKGQIEAVSGRRLIIVLGMMKDKNIAGFLAELTPLASIVICTQIDHPRSARAEELKEQLSASGLSVYAVPVPADAVTLAQQHSTSRDLICVTGSLFLVGAVKSVFAGSAYAPIVG